MFVLILLVPKKFLQGQGREGVGEGGGEGGGGGEGERVGWRFPTLLNNI